MQEIKVSVIVPVYQHWDLAKTLVDALADQTLDARFWELIMVDNGSDKIPDLAELPDFLNLLHCSTAGSYAARNFGLSYAKGELIVFTDADCNPSKTWLEEILKSHTSGSERELIAGAVNICRSSLNEMANAVELYDIALGLPQESYVKRGYAVTANLAIPKAIFGEIGNFDESRFSGGDSEICRRAGKHGFQLRYEPKAIVKHPARSSWVDLETKVRRVKGGQIKADKLSRRMQYLIRSFLPPLRAYLKVFKNKSLLIREKFTIFGVLTRLWMVEVDEVLRLLLGKKPERR